MIKLYHVLSRQLKVPSRPYLMSQSLMAQSRTRASRVDRSLRLDISFGNGGGLDVRSATAMPSPSMAYALRAVTMSLRTARFNYHFGNNMWKFQSKLLDGDCISKFAILANDKQITYTEAIDLWIHNSSFREFFSSLLAEAPLTAYFWETPPVTESTVNREFEFVLVNSPQLAEIEPDPSDFKQYFSSTKEIVTFSNLGNDALLVVPSPISEFSAYTHLASFVREAPQSQQHLLWQTIGKQLKNRLGRQPIWVSTSGLGVYWLHVRLDSHPKYYCFEPYKNAIDD